MNANIIIRREQPDDYGDIYALVKEAFASTPKSDGDEQDYVDELRRGANYIPGLALVAVLNSRIIGHIMFTKTKIDAGRSQYEVLLLSPLCVDLPHRNTGIGRALIKEGFLAAMDQSYHAVLVVGEPRYYGRFGFVAASRYGIRDKKELGDHLMAVELKPGSLYGKAGIVDVL